MNIEEMINRKVCDAKISPAAKGDTINVLRPSNILRYIHKRMVAIFNNCNYGLRYINIERCTAEETMRVLLKRSDKEHDITESNMFLARITFELQGKPIIRYTYIPYVKDKVHINISGTPYSVVNVISDKSISPGLSGVFVRFLKNKINIPYLRYHIIRNKIIKEVIVPHTEPLNPSRPTAAPSVPLLWYILIRYGLTKTIELLHNTKIKIVDNNDVRKYMHDDKWVVYSTVYDAHMRTTSLSSNAKGQRVKTRRDTRFNAWAKRYKYVNTVDFKERKPTTIHFVVKSKDADILMDQTIASLFYVLDIMPGIEKDDLFDHDMIHYILTVIIFKDDNSRTDMNDLRKRFTDKLATLDNHVDSYMVELLHKEFGDTLNVDFTKDGFYSIIRVVFKRYKVWLESARSIVSNVIDKRFEILDYITEPLFFRINKLNFKLSQVYVNKGHVPDAKTIENALTRDLTISIMFGIRTNTPSVTRISYGGDNLYLKNTSTLHIQFNVPSSTGNTTSKKNRKGPAGSRTDPVTLINSSHSFCGTAVAVSKARNSGLKYLNMFTPLDPISSTVAPPEDMLERSNYLDDILRRMANRASSVKLPPEFSISINKRKKRK